MQTLVRRGDIFYVGGGVATGSEQRANRPAVVVSNDAGNRYASIVEMVYLTTREKASLPTHVRINSAEKPSLALCEQIVTVCKSRLERRIGSATAEEMQDIDKALKRSLGIHIMGGELMQVTIVTPFGEMKFTMAPDKMAALMQQAVQYASAPEPEQGTQEKPHPPTTEAIPQMQEPPKTPETMGRPHSRVERMFGDYKVAGGAATKTAGMGDPTDLTAEPEEYKGFIMLKCDRCGKIRGFCAKYPITSSRCDCGHSIELRGLRPAHLKCKCGSKFTYKTNITEERFDYPCLNCGSPVDLEINKRGTAYVTVGD